MMSQSRDSGWNNDPRDIRELRFLAHAAKVLASSSDYTSALRNVTRLAVELPCEWSGIYMGIGDAVRLVAEDLPDRDRHPGIAEARDRVVKDLVEDGLVLSSMRTRQSKAIPSTPPVMVIPLVAREESFGALVLILGPETSRTLAEELGRCAAFAIDNIRLFVEAQEANAVKDRFLAILSHELRNPLATMMAGVELLKRTTAKDPQVDETLSAIERGIRVQSSLVDELLDLSSITQGTVRLQRSPLSLDHLVRSCIEKAYPDAQESRVGLVYDRPPAGEGSSLWVNGDADRLQQVVSNLLSNAIRLTPAGGEIRVNLEEMITRSGSHNARITVTDTGAGMDLETMAHLFEMFPQGETPVKEKRGLGIGLAIARNLTTLHGGWIHADSPGIGKGSTFVVELPLISQPTQPSSGPISESDSSRDAVRILVVEDNRDTRKLLAYTLRNLGYFVQAAGSAEEALEILRSEIELEDAEKGRYAPQTVILADIGLPGINGYQFLQHVRSIEKLHDAVAIAVTGWGSERDVRRAWEVGFNAHFVKPIDIAILDQKIKDLLRAPASAA